MIYTYTDEKDPVVISKKREDENEVVYGFVTSFNENGEAIYSNCELRLSKSHSKFISMNYIPITLDLVINKSMQTCYSRKYNIPISGEKIDVSYLQNAFVDFLRNIQNFAGETIYVLTGRVFNILNQSDLLVKINSPIDISNVSIRVVKDIYRAN